MKAMIALLVAAVALSGCLANYPTQANNTLNSTNGTVQIANPAAKDCVLKGYTYEIRADAAGGQYGVCSKPGYTECEEWALYRGDCQLVPINATDNQSQGLANPASVNCIGKGYNLTIKTDSEGGQYGVCSKPGYTECEEWAFFRDNCSIVPLEANGSANATGREPRAEGQFCGGIAAIPCQEGLHCRLNGTYPDAGGACIKDCGCTLMTNGTAMGCFGCAYVKGTGSFNCTSAPEGWQTYEKKPGAIGIPYACYCANIGTVNVTVNNVNTAYAAHGGCELAQ